MKCVCLLMLLTLASQVFCHFRQRRLREGSTRFRDSVANLSAAAPTKGCNDLQTDKDCDKDNKCQWNKAKKTCDKIATVAKKLLAETDSEGFPAVLAAAAKLPALKACALFKTEKDCQKANCEFKENKCQAKAAAAKRLLAEKDSEGRQELKDEPIKEDSLKKKPVACEGFKIERNCKLAGCEFKKGKCQAEEAPTKKLFEAETDSEEKSATGIPKPVPAKPAACDSFTTEKDCLKNTCEFKANKCQAKAPAKKEVSGKIVEKKSGPSGNKKQFS